MEKPDTLILTEKDRIADTLDESVALWSGLTDELGLAVTGEGITAEDKEVIDNTSSVDQLAVLNSYTEKFRVSIHLNRKKNLFSAVNHCVTSWQPKAKVATSGILWKSSVKG